MEDIKRLELMIKDNVNYDDILKQSQLIDEYIKRKIEGVL